jgi:putative membrane protein insertion efficiency factor
MRSPRLLQPISRAPGPGSPILPHAGWQSRGLALRYTRPHMKLLLIALIDAYRWLLSPFFGTRCRFYPTCSAYAREAIDTHGPMRGSWLALNRLFKCHPWHPGGVDPVPGKPARR